MQYQAGSNEDDAFNMEKEGFKKNRVREEIGDRGLRQ